jgi:D-inositol-3-phosphate glycosyltransferase
VCTGTDSRSVTSPVQLAGTASVYASTVAGLQPEGTSRISEGTLPGTRPFDQRCGFRWPILWLNTLTVGKSEPILASRNMMTSIAENSDVPDLGTPTTTRDIQVALLTGGADRPYAFGLATELMSKGVALDIIGSDELDSPEFHGKPGVNFLNLRGGQRTGARFAGKAFRVLAYYTKLIRYAATARPKIFHVLWNNKFEILDRTLLMFYYRILGKRIVLTVHNVNAKRRDRKDTWINRLTLRAQYRQANHIFVHTEDMKRELSEEFGIENRRVTVIPFGVNNDAPNTPLTPAEAKQRLGIRPSEKVILFFGNIVPYKGLEYLVSAFQQISAPGSEYRLLIAGRATRYQEYWAEIRARIQKDVDQGRVLVRADFIPDEETEVYFKASDVLVLPYRHIYQSGVLFLSYGFGLPVLAADVGSLKDDIVQGRTGFLFRPEDPADLAKIIVHYFGSELFANLSTHREAIRDYVMREHSWDIAGRSTVSVYSNLQPERSVTEVQKSTAVLS